MDPVGQARSACSAWRRSLPEAGCTLTNDVSVASPKTDGAIFRQASQSMQVESTKKSPGTFSGTRFLALAMTGPPFSLFYAPAGTNPFRTPVSCQNGIIRGPRHENRCQSPHLSFRISTFRPGRVCGAPEGKGNLRPHLAHPLPVYGSAFPGMAADRGQD